MPEMRFHVRWPDGREEVCFSPSTTITQHFELGRAYSVADFAAKAKVALEAANERVRARFGMGCAQAVNQAAAIEQTTAAYAGDAGATVTVFRFEP